MTTKFGEFIADKKIDVRRLLVASRKIETLRPEDRAVKLAARLAKKSEDGGGAKPESTQRAKPRSGRPVTQRSVDAALKGLPLTGPQKNRLVRAVNRVLEQRKQDVIDLRALF